MNGKYFTDRRIADRGVQIDATELSEPRNNRPAAKLPRSKATQPAFNASTKPLKKSVEKRKMKKSNDSTSLDVVKDTEKIKKTRHRTYYKGYAVSERTKELSKPKVRNEDPCLDLKPFSVKRSSLKYIASERILALAEPRTRKN